jgi:hypothetical protein
MTRWAANFGGTGSSLPGHLHDPSHRRVRQRVARARARRYPHLTPAQPAVDAIPQEAHAALRRGATRTSMKLWQDAPHSRRSQPRPTPPRTANPEAIRPPPSRPFQSLCRGLDLRDDRRFAQAVRPPVGRRPLLPGRRAFERPRSRPSPEYRDRGGPAVGRNPHARSKKSPAPVDSRGRFPDIYSGEP